MCKNQALKQALSKVDPKLFLISWKYELTNEIINYTDKVFNTKIKPGIFRPDFINFFVTDNPIIKDILRFNVDLSPEKIKNFNDIQLIMYDFENYLDDIKDNLKDKDPKSSLQITELFKSKEREIYHNLFLEIKNKIILKMKKKLILESECKEFIDNMVTELNDFKKLILANVNDPVFFQKKHIKIIFKPKYLTDEDVANVIKIIRKR